MGSRMVDLVGLIALLSMLASGSGSASPSGVPTADTLAFISTVGGTLSLTQTGLVQMPLVKARRVSAFAWSPDGRRIAYLSGTGLNVIGADGTNPRALGATPLDGRIAWSPDARTIAFAAARGQHIRLYTQRVAGGNARVLTTAVPAPLQPSWSPKGTAIAFTSANVNFGGVYVVRPDGSHLRRLAKGREATFPSWSPDGSLLLYQPYSCAGGSCGYGIAVMRPDGSHKRLLTLVPGAPGGGGLHATWSSDGRRIAFVRLGSSIGSDLPVVAVGGGPIRKVATDSRFDSEPAWSPDSRRIAYASASGINLINADGTGKRPFVRYGVLPAWQPRP